MSSVSKRLMGSFVNKLQQIDGQTNMLRKLSMQVKMHTTDKHKRVFAEQAGREAKQMLVEVKTRIDKGAKTPAEADVILDALLDKMYAVKTTVTTTIRFLKEMK